MRHKAIFQRNVCFTLSRPRTQSSLLGQVWTLENVEQLGPDIHESLHDLAPCISQNCEILFSE